MKSSKVYLGPTTFTKALRDPYNRTIHNNAASASKKKAWIKSPSYTIENGVEGSGSNSNLQLHRRVMSNDNKYNFNSDSERSLKAAFDNDSDHQV